MDVELRFQEALTAQRSGDLERAERVYRELLDALPKHPSLLVNLASVRMALGHPEDAVALLERAISLAPEHVNAHNQLGLAFVALRRLEDADAAYAQAIELDPNNLGALNNWALACATAHRYDRALELYKRALAVDPSCVRVMQNLGAMLLDLGKLDDAETCLRRGLAHAPTEAGLRVNLANVLTRRGRAHEALPLLAEAVSARPQEVAWHSNLLMTLHYLEGPSPSEVFAEHLRWARVHGADRASRDLHRSRVRGDKLRVGYVSPDLKNHAVAFFLEPLLRAHDRSRFEVHAYANVAREDETTQRLRGLVDGWHDAFALSDDALVEQIRKDRIDVLVDLAGHTAGHRLLAFTRQPAPVQMSYLGYPDTTGVAAIRYRLTDIHCDPPGSEAFHREMLLHVEGGMHCYQPPRDAPEVGPLPATARGHLTFGSFNNTAKLTESVIARWARVLTALPSARMHLKFPTLSDTGTAKAYLGWFERHGVSPEKVTLHGSHYEHGTHLAAHREVDVVLDAFPYHGTTTTCEALWMGVPVLTLVGDRHVSRVGASLLGQVGLERFAVMDEATLQERALELASPSGIAALASLRAALRDRMRKSPLCDGPAKARALEACFLSAFFAYEAASPTT